MRQLLIFVPGYNVSKTIWNVMDNLVKIRSGLCFDILYVDNASTDDSVAIVKEFIQKRKINYIAVIKNPYNLGYGGSQKVAFRYAFKNNYHYLLEYDGDMQYPAEAIPALYKKIVDSGSSIVFGSRVSAYTNMKQMPLIKQIGNLILNYINNWGFGFGVSEIHTGLRIYDLKKLRNINLGACHNDYRWTLDSVVEAMKICHKFSEISVKGLYHRYISSPSVMDIIKIGTYMVYRAIIYRFFKR